MHLLFGGLSSKPKGAPFAHAVCQLGWCLRSVFWGGISEAAVSPLPSGNDECQTGEKLMLGILVNVSPFFTVSS